MQGIVISLQADGSDEVESGAMISKAEKSTLHYTSFENGWKGMKNRTVQAVSSDRKMSDLLKIMGAFKKMFCKMCVNSLKRYMWW